MLLALQPLRDPYDLLTPLSQSLKNKNTMKRFDLQANLGVCPVVEDKSCFT